MPRKLRALACAIVVVAAGTVAGVMLFGGSAPARPKLPLPNLSGTTPHAIPVAARAGGAAARRGPAPAQQQRLRRALGSQAAVDVDPVTRRLRSVARLNGFLTGPSNRPPGQVARTFIRRHAGAFGIVAGDLATLDVAQRRDSSAAGLGSANPPAVTHLVMAQSVHGIPVVGADVTANVTDDGRLLSIGGSPATGLGLPSGTPPLDGRAALGAARRAVSDARPAPSPLAVSGASTRDTTFPAGDRAALVVWAGAGPARLAWRVLFTDDQSRMWDSIVDASSGDVLRRNSLTDSANAAQVFDHYPGATDGGAQHSVDLTPYLDAGASTLSGPFALAYSDVNSDNALNAGEQVDAAGGDFSFARTPVPAPGQTCPALPTDCDWNPAAANSWQTNRKADATNLFWLVNRFHDHLAAWPIDFTAAKGAFEGTSNRLLAEDLDGAALGGGVGDANHLNNANMNTPPKGANPRMQMYLWQNPFRAVMGGFDAEVVLHEYTHGLSNRLVVDSQGFSALNEQVSRSMGEAWSDWYAVDYLVSQGLVDDTSADGDVGWNPYADPGNTGRTEPFDCSVGGSASACPGTTQAGTGGYTLADLGRIAGARNSTSVDPRPEVHADGEIWVQTLWDLRQKLLELHPVTGVHRAELLVTRGMELSLESPSFIDMRNAILQADTVFLGGEDRAEIWQVFAHRGMGYFASEHGGDDYRPVEDTSVPPAAGSPTGTVSGTVTDAGTSAPVEGVRVRVGGHDAATGEAWSAVTDAAGHYAVTGVPVGTYPDVLTDETREYPSQYAGPVTVTAGATATKDVTLQRNWAAAASGALARFGAGTNFTNCGPLAINDGDLHAGWGSQNPTSGPYVLIRLPRQIDITKLSIDPTARCGGAPTNDSLGGFQIYTAASDGQNLTFKGSGTFTATNQGHFNDINISLPSTQWIALQATSSQGGSLVVTSELQAYGVPTNQTGAPSARTEVADGIGNTGATLHGTVDPQGDATTTVFQYGEQGDTHTVDAQPVGAAAGATAVSAALTGLKPGTTYRFRVGATNSHGTRYGNSRTFTTDGIAPLVATGNATDFTNHAATVHGTVVINNPVNPVQTHFEYGAAATYGQSSAPAPAPGGSGDQAVQAALTGLAPATTYHYRLVVTDGARTITGDDATFATAANQPPSATVELDEHAPATNETLTATATRGDPDGDPVSLHYVWQVGGVTKRDVVKSTGTADDLSDAFDLSVAGNGDQGDQVTVAVTPNDGTTDGTTVSDSATVTALACTIMGTSGDDALSGTSGADVICGEGGNDRLAGGGGDDVLRGGGGDDRLIAGPGADVMEGGAGEDVVDYRARTTAVAVSIGDGANDGSPGEGDDVQADVEDINGGSGADTLTGDGAANHLWGLGGNDQLNGGAGPDVLYGGAGADTFSGGDGGDMVSYRSESAPVIASIGDGANDGTAGEGDDIQSDVERLVGGNGNDQLTGDGSNNRLFGRAGNDQLTGSGGDDRLIGGTGADTMAGGAGLDRADYRVSADPVTVTIGTGADDGITGEGDDVQSDVEEVLGSPGDDSLTGDASANVLNGEAGNDTIAGGGGGDRLVGGPGDDGLTGGIGIDTVFGDAGGDIIHIEGDGATVDHASCGSGVDVVFSDPADALDADCENH